MNTLLNYFLLGILVTSMIPAVMLVMIISIPLLIAAAMWVMTLPLPRRSFTWPLTHSSIVAFRTERAIMDGSVQGH